MKITKTEAREVAAKIFGHNRAEEKEDGESFYTFSCGLFTVLIEKYYGVLSSDKHPNGCLMIDKKGVGFSVVNGEIELNWTIDDILPRARYIAMYLFESVDADGKVLDNSELVKARAAALEFNNKY